MFDSDSENLQRDIMDVRLHEAKEYPPNESPNDPNVLLTSTVWVGTLDGQLKAKSLISGEIRLRTLTRNRWGG